MFSVHVIEDETINNDLLLNNYHICLNLIDIEVYHKMINDDLYHDVIIANDVSLYVCNQMKVFIFFLILIYLLVI